MDTRSPNKSQQKASQKKSNKKYWQTLEERTAPDMPSWQKPEFPVSRNEMLNQMKEDAKTNGINRSNFLKFMGAGAVMVSAACRKPTEQIVPAVIQPPEVKPGMPLYYSSSTPDGNAITVKTLEGRPVKISGNPDHPLFQGGLPAYNVADIMDLYDPDRLRRPVKFENNQQVSSSHDEIIREARRKLADGSYVLLTGPVNSPSARVLVQNFLNQYPGGRHFELRQDPTLRQIQAGQQAAYGNSAIPFYRFDRASYIVSIDGDFLGSMPNSAAYTKAFSKGRDLKADRNRMNKLISFESTYSVTGSMADERIAVRPGDQTSVALALAANIVIKMGRSQFSGNTNVRNLLENYIPERSASALKIDQNRLEQFANALWANRGNSIVVAGSPLAANGSNASLQVAVNFLNSILDNDGRTVDYTNSVGLAAGSSERDIQALLESLRSGEVSTLIVADCNPAYHLPASFAVQEALSEVDYVLALTDRIDETTKLSDAALPVSHYMESWSDIEPVTGFFSICQPTIRPLYRTKSIEDILIELAGGQIGGHETFHDFIQNRWQQIHARNGSPGSFREFWQSVLQKGYFAPGQSNFNTTGNARGFNIDSLQALPREPEGSGLRLGLYYGVQVLDGKGANNAYRQELPDPVSKTVYENFVGILPATARKHGWKQGTIANIKTAEGEITLPIHLMPGIHPDGAVIALGYGREAAGRVGNGLGENAGRLIQRGSDSFMYSGQSVEIQSTGRRHNIANTQTIFREGLNTEDKPFYAPESLPGAPYAGSSDYDRPVLLEETFEDYKNDAEGLYSEQLYIPKNANVIPQWNYNGLRWHMIVDLSQCTGCGSCVTSCNIENNIPMVGPDEVRRGREMHWIRIDRYFAGSEESPEVSHQPMLCQHCENAPCENVCPVAATTHTSEGLNTMTYNRCVGTRYCANNCPYKVRRFNWFEYWYYMEGLERKIGDPQHLGLNPNVTIRSRGVMEKCSFCVQRLNKARQDMRAQGKDRIVDGSVKTACQEVCPTDAIAFGDINDPDSKVAKLSTDDRGYKVLDFLGVNPSITYLAKIRNKSRA